MNFFYRLSSKENVASNGNINKAYGEEIAME